MKYEHNMNLSFCFHSPQSKSESIQQTTLHHHTAPPFICLTMKNSINIFSAYHIIWTTSLSFKIHLVHVMFMVSFRLSFGWLGRLCFAVYLSNLSFCSTVHPSTYPSNRRPSFVNNDGKLWSWGWRWRCDDKTGIFEKKCSLYLCYMNGQ